VVDQRAVDLFRDWITGMPKNYGMRSVKLPSSDELMKSNGNAKNGQLVFDRTCSVCHRVSHRGADFGPDLTQVATRLQRDKIIESVLKPDAVIDEKYKHTALRLNSGEVLSGIVTSESADAVVLRQTGGKTQTISVKDIAKRIVHKTSAMPTGLENALSAQELTDLIEYLTGLK
jgi:putative heme-binding domain-containing protein